MSDPNHWFSRARFGLFVHWGLFSAKGLEPSWPLVGGSPAFPYCQQVSVGDYYREAETWLPPIDAPREWVRLAKAAGMQYAVLTTKHHDGFSLFDSPHSAFGLGRNAAGHDLVGSFVRACRDEGLRVGLYFSLPDWHHPDYPAFTDAMRPYPFIAYPRPEPERWARFLDDMQGQLRHLLTAYGTIDLLWFDGGWERQAHEWHADEIEALVRGLQPDIVINDRLPGVGDYPSPEQGLPQTPIEGWWETCMTMNHSWGPVEADPERKSARYLLSILADVAQGGGNLLLNVSPDGQGRLLPWQSERLETIAGWMQRHAEAVIGTDRGLAPGQFYGPTTRRDRTTYLFCPMRPRESVTLRQVRGRRIESIRAVGSGRPLEFELRLSAMDRLFIQDPLVDVIIHIDDADCDDLMTVLAVTERAA